MNCTAGEGEEHASDPEATNAAFVPPKQERMMKRGCRLGSMRYSIAGSLKLLAASSAHAADTLGHLFSHSGPAVAMIRAKSCTWDTPCAAKLSQSIYCMWFCAVPGRGTVSSGISKQINEDFTMAGCNKSALVNPLWTSLEYRS